MTSARQIYLGSRRGPALPYDAEVEYLESTGTQWIQTDWTPDLRVNLVVDGYFGFTTSGRGMLLSAFTGSGTDYNLSLELYSSATLRMYVNGDDIKAAHSPATINSLFKMAVEYSASTGAVYLYNGGFTGAGTVSSGNRFLNTRTARLGNDYRNTYSYGMFGPFKVFNPDLVLDMIPVRFTNEAGQSEGAMYDRVSRQLFRNAGTNAFTIGPDKTWWTPGVPAGSGRYVQDGLVAMWDGLENAGAGVHDKSASAWKDLTGNGYDFPASGLFFFSDSVALKGSENVLSVKSTSPEFWDWNSATVEAVCERPSPTSVKNNGFFNFHRIGITISTGGTGSTYYWATDALTSNWVGYYLFRRNGIDSRNYDRAHRALVVGNFASKNNPLIYRNGSYVSSSNYYAETWTTNVSHDAQPLILYKGGQGVPTFYSIRLYSRALTAEEIAANYAIDKERFNLP